MCPRATGCRPSSTRTELRAPLHLVLVGAGRRLPRDQRLAVEAREGAVGDAAAGGRTTSSPALWDERRPSRERERERESARRCHAHSLDRVTLIEGQGLFERRGHGQNARIMSRRCRELDRGGQTMLGGPARKRSSGPAGGVEREGQADQAVAESEFIRRG